MRTLGILAAVVTALLVGLWFLVVRDTDTPVTAATTGSAESATKEQPVPATQPSSRARTGSGTVIMRRPTTQPTAEAPTASQGGDPPALGSDTGSALGAPTLKETLRDQVMFSEPQIAECNEKALKAGRRLDGATAVAFKVARTKDGKIVAEPTGIEYSSIADQGVVDCIRDAAKTMVFDSLPEGVDSLTGYRKVVLKDGAVVENWLTEYTIAEPKPAN